MTAVQCRAERPGGRRGDRIIRCGNPAGHPGEHEEADTEVTWSDPPAPPVPTSVLAVTLAAPDGLNATSYTESILRMVAYDAVNDGVLIRGGGPMLLPASPNTLSKQRNAAAAFLLDESQADWLLFIDSDMGYDEDAVYRLLEVAEPAERPIVGALCFGLRKTESDARGGWRTQPFPTVYDWKINEETGKPGFCLRYDYTPDVVTRVAATGAAFLLIHRSVLDKLRANYGDTWFDRGRMEADEDLMGEDISFCARVGRAGIPMYVHTGVKTTHLKPVWVDEEYYLAQRALAVLRAEHDKPQFVPGKDCQCANGCSDGWGHTCKDHGSDG